MNEKVKGAAYGIISVLGNMIVLGIVPVEYKIWALLIFNLAQVVYAYFDPSYALVAIGKKLGRVLTKEDLK